MIYIYICIYMHTYMHTCMHACMHPYSQVKHSSILSQLLTLSVAHVCDTCSHRYSNTYYYVVLAQISC